MKELRIFYLLFFLTASCLHGGCQQKKSNKVSHAKHVGGPCEGCEAIYESPVPFQELKNTDTFPDFAENGPKLLVTGTVFEADGKTPASGIVVYAYHTNQQGIYPRKGNETGWGRRHGYLRGWTRTGRDGNYSFYTLRPAAYPGRSDPAHIHFLVKEPDKNEYYIDDIVFADDVLLKASYKSRLQQRGGSGIITLVPSGNFFVARRDIILGKNIPDYPAPK